MVLLPNSYEHFISDYKKKCKEIYFLFLKRDFQGETIFFRNCLSDVTAFKKSELMKKYDCNVKNAHLLDWKPTVNINLQSAFSFTHRHLYIDKHKHMYVFTQTLCLEQDVTQGQFLGRV